MSSSFSPPDPTVSNQHHHHHQQQQQDASDWNHANNSVDHHHPKINSSEANEDISDQLRRRRSRRKSSTDSRRQDKSTTVDSIGPTYDVASTTWSKSDQSPRTFEENHEEKSSTNRSILSSPSRSIITNDLPDDDDDDVSHASTHDQCISSPSEITPCLALNHSNQSLQHVASVSVGLLDDHLYQTQMTHWRFKIRQILIKNLKKEIKLLELIQRKTRNGVIDKVMIRSSWLGSHQFYILALPLIFWIGNLHDLARCLVYILAMSVYFTGIFKDFFCIPRPFSPPIHRLSISNHAAEYGFPSTHSATSSAIALLGLQFTLKLNSNFLKITLFFSLFLYEFLLVFGRVYCGMHSIQDVFFGSILGIFSWTIQELYGRGLEEWVTSTPATGSTRIQVPIILIISGLILTAAHPQPIEDCPCFEDSTAFVAVSVGVMTGHWMGHPFISHLQSNHLHVQFPHALFKLFLGLSVLFLWRFCMKEILSRLLPPIFKFFAPLLELPRRHHTTTKDYNQYRDELREYRKRIGLRSRLIPSVVHLPKLNNQSINQLNLNLNSNSTHSNDHFNHLLHPALRHRNPSSTHVDPLSSSAGGTQPGSDSPPLEKRYDVDVLMRFFVYFGIGFLSCYGLPLLFNQIGLDN